MFRYIVAVLLVASIGWVGLGSPQGDVLTTLGRAEELYLGANFKESVELLAPLDAALGRQPGREQEKISVKLQLALGYVGLNETSKAKSKFLELCELDSNCSLDPQRFSLKVRTLFDEAKAERDQTMCRSICATADKQLEDRDIAALQRAIATGPKCGCLRAITLDAGELSYQQGLEAYKEEDLKTALQKFQDALGFNSEHAIASQYVEVTQNRLRLVAEQNYLEWRRNLDTGEIGTAKTGYRQLLSLNIAGSAAKPLEQMRTEYRRVLSLLVQSWNRACAIGDKAAMDDTRARAVALLPDRAIGEDLLRQMETCTSKTCIAMETQLAMDRVKTSSSPEIPPSLQGLLQDPLFRTVNVKARIDEKGDVLVVEARGLNTSINDAVRISVEKWKFFPIIVQNEARCVDTVFPILIAPVGR